MTIYNLGSINRDYFYAVPHLPGPGETIAAPQMSTGLGGKGANQSVAAAKSGARVMHIGAVGPDGDWTLDRLSDYGVDISHVTRVDAPTAHAIINVDPQGENAIVIFSGASINQDMAVIRKGLAEAGSADTLLLQNETSHQVEAAEQARGQGVRVIYSAAPFDVDAVRAMLPLTDLLIVNEIEAKQLSSALDTDLDGLPVPELLTTKGSKGAEWRDLKSGARVEVKAFDVDVDVVDTTGAGDTFAGAFAAMMDQGADARAAMVFASACSALQVTKKGTADAIPTRAEVDLFLAKQR